MGHTIFLLFVIFVLLCAWIAARGEMTLSKLMGLKHAGLAAMILVGLMCSPAPARADTSFWNNPAANVNLVLMLGDMYTTRSDLRSSPTFQEGNPLAAPFVKTNAGAIGYAVGVNLIERVLFRHKRIGTWNNVNALEVSAIYNNYLQGKKAGVNFAWVLHR